eukprot:PRCOL_00002273-RA
MAFAPAPSAPASAGAARRARSLAQPSSAARPRANQRRRGARRSVASASAANRGGGADGADDAPLRPERPSVAARRLESSLNKLGGWLGSRSDDAGVVAPAAAAVATKNSAGGVGKKAEREAQAGPAPWERAEAEEAAINDVEKRMGDAAAREDFAEAAALRDEAAALREGDLVGKVLDASERAVAEERYADAAALRDGGGAGLVGWWAADRAADGTKLPSGHVLCITAQHGRLVGRTVRPVDLAEGADGAPALEFFPREVGEGRYELDTYAIGDPVAEEAEDAEAEGSAGEGGAEASAPGNIWAEAQEQLMNVLSMSQGGAQSQTQSQPKEQEGAEGGARAAASAPADESARDGLASVDGDALVSDLLRAELAAGAAGAGEVELQRHPAKVEWQSGPGAFSLRVDGADAAAVAAWRDAQLSKDALMSAVDVGLPDADTEGGVVTPLRDALGELSSATIEDISSTKGASADMVVDDENEDDEEGRAVEEQMRMILESEFARMQGRLSQAPPSALYRRLDTSARGTMQGLFIGSFGPHGPEAVQLVMDEASRIFHDDDDGDFAKDPSELCVMATKVTGDNNVHAGEVTFRARVGRGSKLDPREVFPDDLGVTARYPGQGRVAQAGFTNPQWVDGELLVFDSRGAEMTGGAELGFVWAVPGERRFLVLFNRLVAAKGDARMDVLVKGVSASAQ